MENYPNLGRSNEVENYPKLGRPHSDIPTSLVRRQHWRLLSESCVCRCYNWGDVRELIRVFFG